MKSLQMFGVILYKFWRDQDLLSQPDMIKRGNRVTKVRFIYCSNLLQKYDVTTRENFHAELQYAPHQAGNYY